MKPFSRFRVLLNNGSHSIKEQSVSDRDWSLMLMKRISYLLLFAYSLVIIKPVVPVFADVIAHVFYEKEHVIVHEVHGQFHVHYEVANALGKTNRDKHSATITGDTEESLYILPDLPSFNVSSFLFASISYPSLLCNLSRSFPYVHYPPPKA
jgi:hypothetical protein